jgi:hypothetical protein
MKRKTVKPTYGNSQGAKPDRLDLDRNSNNKSKPLKQQYAQTDKLADRQYLQLRSDAKSIHSLPRTVFKLTIVGIITTGLLTHTQTGKSITAQFLAQLSTGQKTAQSTLDLNQAKERKQKAFDDRFDDAWEKAGGKSERKNK